MLSLFIAILIPPLFKQEYDPDLPPELAVAAGLHEAGDRIQHRSLESEATASTMGRRGHTPIIVCVQVFYLIVNILVTLKMGLKFLFCFDSH